MALDFSAIEEIIHELEPPIDSIIIEDFVENLVESRNRSQGRNQSRNRNRAENEEMKNELIEYTKKYKETDYDLYDSLYEENQYWMNLHGMSFMIYGDGNKILVSFYIYYSNSLRFMGCDYYDYGGGDCSVFEQLKCMLL